MLLVAIAMTCAAKKSDARQVARRGTCYLAVSGHFEEHARLGLTRCANLFARPTRRYCYSLHLSDSTRSPRKLRKRTSAWRLVLQLVTHRHRQRNSYTHGLTQLRTSSNARSVQQRPVQLQIAIAFTSSFLPSCLSVPFFKCLHERARRCQSKRRRSTRQHLCALCIQVCASH